MNLQATQQLGWTVNPDRKPMKVIVFSDKIFINLSVLL